MPSLLGQGDASPKALTALPSQGLFSCTISVPEMAAAMWAQDSLHQAGDMFTGYFLLEVSGAGNTTAAVNALPRG